MTAFGGSNSPDSHRSAVRVDDLAIDARCAAVLSGHKCLVAEFGTFVIIPTQAKMCGEARVRDTSALEVYVDGILDLEFLGGENVRVTYFTWMSGEKVPVVNIVRPMSSFQGDMSARVRSVKAERDARLRQEAVALN